MDKIIEQILNIDQIKNVDSNKSFKANSIESVGLTISASFLKENKNIAIVVPSLYDCQTLVDFISNFVDPNLILFYPYDEILRIDTLYSSKELLKERIRTLYKICNGKSKYILVTNSVSTIHTISSKSRFKENIIHIKKGDCIPPSSLLDYLISKGYSKVNKVEEVFQFSKRGEILDVFTPSNSNPIRIEYFDDEIESIREFSSSSELSFKELEEFDLVPAIENIFTNEELKQGQIKIENELNKLENNQINEELITKTNLFLSTINQGGINDTKTRYLPYFTDKNISILSYLDDFLTYFYRYDDLEYTLNNYYLEARNYFKELKESSSSLPSQMNCFEFSQALVQKADYRIIEDETSNMDVTSIPYHFTNINYACKLIDTLISDGYKTYIYLKEDQLESFKKVAQENNKRIDLSLNDNGYQVVLTKNITSGLMLPKLHIAICSSKEIFGSQDSASIFLKRFKEAKLINKYQDLEVGDYVVHQEQGIGKYLGITKIDGLECLSIQYAGKGQILHVPLSKFMMIRKYSSKEGKVPTLDTLGGATWAKRKAKIRGRISYLADKLIEIAAQRKALPGYSFCEDNELEDRFEQAFAYKLTPSQQKAWNDIKKDMMSSHPMDRLLTGDVGFGKTEVAFKGVFKCVLSNKQAALLCPTTVLSMQHYQVAIKRFEGFNVKIALLNRNVSLKEKKQILEDLEQGKIDFLIGTHRILGDDVKFKDLGLLVVDEEQRFGVTHKEKIKSITTNIDVLTLTATPIPRTLQMSLLNVRPLSLLDNPPNNRMPIKTYVVRYDLKLIREVISRELARKGQVYYLHNRIATMNKTIETLQKMFPNKVVGGVHGQEDGEDISKTMEDFYNQKIDILVCTSIIETGLDVPNCNTIIVERAENFGLAQLYQIKGRVGRSSKLGYAYLTYPSQDILTDESKKRLKALKDFTELGSGYKIATEDLNIRGAGDILGKEQAGFIDSIGYDAYSRLLEEVMKEKQVVLNSRSDIKKNKFEISFSLDASIPSNYASEQDRINIYREMYDIDNVIELNEYKDKVKDVYGKLPVQVENLFLKKETEIYLENSNVFEQINEYIDRFEIKLAKQFSCKPKMSNKLGEIFLKMDDRNITIRFSLNSFRVTLMKDSEYLFKLFNIVTTLIKLDN